MATTRHVRAYLAQLVPRQRAALARLRQAIRSAAPDAEEYFNGTYPAFRRYGEVVAYAAAKHHCALYVSPSAVAAHARELTRFDTKNGTVRFQPERPLSKALVRKLVRASIAEHIQQLDGFERMVALEERRRGLTRSCRSRGGV